jgi:hypothetical protein
MPSHFDRFRLLNMGGEKRLRNEGDKDIYVRAVEEDEPFIIHPGMEATLPESPAGETILDVLDDTP